MPDRPCAIFGRCLFVGLFSLLSSCALFRPPEPGIGKEIPWSKVDGWKQDNHQEAWPALLSSCEALQQKPIWDRVCSAAGAVSEPDQQTAQEFFETWFAPHVVHGSKRKTKGLITGYYEPLLYGSFEPSDRYRYPLYARPESLLIIDLGDRFPELRNQRLRGRLTGNKVIPYFSRAEIEADRELLQGNELVWLDNRDDVFFLHIQGSGRIQLPDGRIVGVGYSDQNGHPYHAIGRTLVERGELELDQVSLFSIKQWLREHADQAEDLLNQNPSYIFFVLREDPGQGPIGSLNVPLTAERSIAIDPELINLGTPMWLSTHYPGDSDKPLKKLVFAQDTGGAIKGHLRADLFWGHDRDAEQAAGTMKSPGSLIVLLPKQHQDQE
ncbi:MAG: murein transglycosylase A [bacterium]